ncbi:MAG: hypothetical protein IJ189_09900 [Clostridia bacterium]|nr:hypothetical protein [Clostridia bacterium]
MCISHSPFVVPVCLTDEKDYTTKYMKNKDKNENTYNSSTFLKKVRGKPLFFKKIFGFPLPDWIFHAIIDMNAAESSQRPVLLERGRMLLCT